MEAVGGGGVGIEFDKDDSISMRFVAAASNLRSRVFQVGRRKHDFLHRVPDATAGPMLKFSPAHAGTAGS